MAGYITGTSRVCVVSPSSSKRCRLLQDSVSDEEIVTCVFALHLIPDPQLLKAFPHANTRDASAQHNHMEVCGRRGRRWRRKTLKESEDGKASQDRGGRCPTLEKNMMGFRIVIKLSNQWRGGHGSSKREQEGNHAGHGSSPKPKTGGCRHPSVSNASLRWGLLWNLLDRLWSSQICCG